MIRQAKSGDPILLIRGCATASSVDPIGEGQRWVKGQELLIRAWLERKDENSNPPETRSIVVVGLGSGYHIQALYDSVAHLKALEVVVIESDPDIVAMSDWFASRLNPAIKIAFVEKLDQSKFFDHQVVRRAVSSGYLLLRHKPSFIRNAKEMSVIASWLTARDRSSLEKVLELQSRRELREGLDLARLTTSLISVKDLSRAWKVEFEPSRERRIFRVLEELVR